MTYVSNYMSSQEWSTWKRRLASAKKKTPQDVIDVCEAFFKRESDDHVCLLWRQNDWYQFNTALDAARLEQRRVA